MQDGCPEGGADGAGLAFQACLLLRANCSLQPVVQPSSSDSHIMSGGAGWAAGAGTQSAAVGTAGQLLPAPCGAAQARTRAAGLHHPWCDP